MKLASFGSANRKKEILSMFRARGDLRKIFHQFLIKVGTRKKDEEKAEAF